MLKGIVRFGRLGVWLMMVGGLFLPLVPVAGAAHIASGLPSGNGSSDGRPDAIDDHPFDPQGTQTFIQAATSRSLSHVVADRRGAFHGVFYDSTSEMLMYTTSPAVEDGTGAAVPISAAPLPARSKYPRIAVDDGGAVHVIWIENHPEANGDRNWVRYAWCITRCTQAGSWQVQADSLPLDVPLFCEIVHPSIVAWGFGANRRIAVAVEQHGDNPSKTALKVVQYAEGIWQPFDDVSDDTVSSFVFTPAVAVNRTNGTLHVVWLNEIIGSATILQHRQWNEGSSYAAGSWQPSIELINDPVTVGGPHVVNLTEELWSSWFVNTYALVVDAAGVLQLAFPYAGNNQQEPWHMQCAGTCESQASWSAPRSIVQQANQCSDIAQPFQMHHSMRLAAAADGRVYAMWRRLNSTNPATATLVEIYTATLQQGQWSSPELVDAFPFTYAGPNDPPSHDLQNLDLMIGKRDLPAATWLRYRFNQGQPYQTQYLPPVSNDAPYTLRVTQNTVLPTDGDGCQMLTVHANTGWYEQPLISYTISLENHVTEPLYIKLEFALDSINATRSRVYAPDLSVEDEDSEYGLMELVAAPQATTTRVITVIAQPSSEDQLTGLVLSTITTPDHTGNPQSVDLTPIHFPTAAIRPVVIVPGFLGSYHDNNPLTGLTLDPLIGTYDGLVDTLKFYGYEESSSLIKFPYEWWEADLHDVANVLHDKLSHWWGDHTAPAYVRTDQFDVVAHSEGGLVIRAYEDILNSSNEPFPLHTVMTAGTPHQGTPAAYAAYEGLDTLLNEEQHTIVDFSIFRGIAAKNGCHTTPVAAPFFVTDNLLYTYLHGDPCPHGSPEGIPLLAVALTPHTATGDPGRGIPPEYLFDAGGRHFGAANPVLDALNMRADDFLQKIEANQGVFVSFYSDTQNTINRYNVVPTPPQHLPLWAHGMPAGWTPEVYGNSALRDMMYLSEPNGDDTVPGWSANLAFIPAAKAFIVGSPTVHIDKRVKNIGHTFYYKTESGLQITIGMLINPQLIDGAGEIPTYFPLPPIPDTSVFTSGRRILFNYCPVDILLVDTQGRRIGTTSTGENINEIPGAYYSGPYDDTPSIFMVPDNLELTMHIVGREAVPYTILDYHTSEMGLKRSQMWTGILESGQQRSEQLPAFAMNTPIQALIVEDTSTATSTLYEQDLARFGYETTGWGIANDGMPAINDLFDYDLVIWTSTQSDMYPASVQTTLEAYLRAGGGVLIASPQTGLRFDATTRESLLKITNVQPSSAQHSTVVGQRLLAGIVDMPVPAHSYVLTPTADAVSVLYYQADQRTAASAVDRGGRLFYSGIDLHALADDPERQRVLWRISTWLRQQEQILYLPRVQR